MQSKKPLSNVLIFNVILFSLILSGCRAIQSPPSATVTEISAQTLLTSTTSATVAASARVIETSTTSPQLTKPPTQIPIPKKTITPTLIATLDEQTRKTEVYNLLQNNGGCELPCFWGITPGKTDVVTAVQYFQQMGWRGANYQNYGGNFYETSFEDLADYLGISVTIYDNDNDLNALSIGIGSNQFNRRAEYFSINNILKSLGQPDRIALSLAVGLEIATPQITGYTLWLFYDDLGIMLRYSGSAQKFGNGYRICPLHPNESSTVYSDDFGDVGIVIQSELITETLENTYSRFSGDAEGVKPIEDATGKTVTEFYLQALQNLDRRFCFNTPRDIWP